MTPDPDVAPAEGSADKEVEDLEPTDPEVGDVTGGAGKGGSIVVMDPTNVTRP